jgi:hypothetical protein
MVRNTARSEQTRRAAALTPSTPQSFVPSRKGSSSGLFDVGAIASGVHPRQPGSSMPTPSLILPITGPAAEEPTRSRSAYPPLPPIPALPRRKNAYGRPKPTTWDRVSDVASMLGFAAAWIATTGLGAVVVAALMTRDQTSPTMLAGGLSAAAPVCEASPPCPRTWEPPLVAVTDLPIAPGPRHGATPPAWAQVHESAPAPPAAPVVAAVPRRFESATLAATKKADPSPAMTLRSSRAKTANAQPAGPPHSLEDWIRRAVSSDAKQPHSS